MADAFSPTLAVIPTNIRGAGAANLKVKVGTDVAFYYLGAPRDLKVNSNPLSKPDSLMRIMSWGLRDEFMVPTLQASITEAKILDQLILKSLAGFEIQQLDGIYINDTTGIFQLSWVWKSSGDFNDYRTVEYTIAGNHLTTEESAIFNTSAVTPGTPNAGDALFTLTQTNVAANQLPNGLSSLEFKASGDSTFAKCDISEATYQFESVFELGGGGRGYPRNYGIKFTMDAKLKQTSTTEMALFGSMNSEFKSVRLTHLDGLIITLPYTNVNFNAKFVNDGNFDKARHIAIHGEGAFSLNAAGTAIADTAGNAWDTFFTHS